MIRRIFATAILALIIISCEAGLLEDWFNPDHGGSNQKRSMAETLTDFIDVVYPKDDQETSIMKRIFMMFSEEGMPDLGDVMSGLEFVFES